MGPRSLLILPYLVAFGIAVCLMRWWRGSDRPTRVAPGVWVGGRTPVAALPPGVTAVVDLVAVGIAGAELSVRGEEVRVLAVDGPCARVRWILDLGDLRDTGDRSRGLRSRRRVRPDDQDMHVAADLLRGRQRVQNRGLKREMLAPGTRATVVGYPNRTDPDEMRAERITIAGKTTELR